MLFYWWPVWVFGFLMALVTYFEDHRLAIVPHGSKLVAGPTDEKGNTEYILSVAGKTKSLDQAVEATKTAGTADTFPARVSQKSWLGPVFCTVLLLTIVITNVPLRGLWSFIVILILLAIVLMISMIHGGWDAVFGALFHLHIHINMAGYLFLGTAVFILWFVAVFVFDQRTYMVVTPGSIKVCEHIGASIRNFDTTGLQFEKQRDDLFRHWLFGFFSGDLIVRTAGAQPETIRLPNVLWIGWRLEEVQNLLREKAIVHVT